MTRLADVATSLRSKNAGPFLLTIDVIFRDRESYDRAVAARVVTPAVLARLYNVDESDVRVIEFPIGNAIKTVIPRLVSAGDIADTDVYGAQQHVPLMSLELPDA